MLAMYDFDGINNYYCCCCCEEAKTVLAMYDFDGINNDDLSFKKGDRLKLESNK